MCEQGLVAAAKRGQSAAFEALCQPYARKLEQTTFRITRNREDAEDAIQDALLNAFVHLRDFDCRSSFSTWLTRIAINSALMILRKRRNSLETALSIGDDFGAEAPSLQIVDHAPDPEKRYAQYEKETILHTAIRRLRPKLRRTVEFQHLQERSIRETARTLNISIAATKGRLFHAKAVLRKSLTMKLTYRPKAVGRLRILSAA
jgi:RNA polymerase sigma factor (sigma-70 family)